MFLVAARQTALKTWIVVRPWKLLLQRNAARGRPHSFHLLVAARQNRFENVDRGETVEAPGAAGCCAWTAASLSFFGRYATKPVERFVSD